MMRTRPASALTVTVATLIATTALLTAGPVTNGVASTSAPPAVVVAPQLDLAAMSNVNHGVFARDPFWPPGYIPRALRDEDAPPPPEEYVPAPTPKDVKPTWPELVIKGFVTRAGAPLALIDDVRGAVGENELFERRVGAYVFEWRMLKINVAANEIETKPLRFRRAE